MVVVVGAYNNVRGGWKGRESGEGKGESGEGEGGERERGRVREEKK